MAKEILPHEKQIYEYEKTISQFSDQNSSSGLLDSGELEQLRGKLDQLRKRVYEQLSPWERITICRHPARPRAVDYLNKMCDSFTELHGDRLFRDDPAVIGGLAYIGGVKCVVIGQEKGCDTESRMQRNFGMLHPEGYRKALRLMKLAEKFQLPVVTLIDTPGAYAGLTAEERGQGWAIAENLREMARLHTPIIVVIIGEGCSGGALGMAVGDSIGMLEHSYYSVITPEGCASILWKDAGYKEEAAQALRLHAEDLLRFQIIDKMIPEPLGGAHHQPEIALNNVREFILTEWERLKQIAPAVLIENRYQKFRRMGEVLIAESL